MATQIIRSGGTVRLVVSPRGIIDSEIVNGDLVFDYSDGTTDNLGPIASGGVIANALVGRDTGDYLVSRETGDVLVGRV